MVAELSIIQVWVVHIHKYKYSFQKHIYNLVLSLPAHVRCNNSEVGIAVPFWSWLSTIVIGLKSFDTAYWCLLRSWTALDRKADSASNVSVLFVQITMSCENCALHVLVLKCILIFISVFIIDPLLSILCMLMSIICVMYPSVLSILKGHLVERLMPWRSV